jgi:hypothetical protein
MANKSASEIAERLTGIRRRGSGPRFTRQVKFYTTPKQYAKLEAYAESVNISDGEAVRLAIQMFLESLSEEEDE